MSLNPAPDMARIERVCIEEVCEGSRLFAVYVDDKQVGLATTPVDAQRMAQACRSTLRATGERATRPRRGPDE